MRLQARHVSLLAGALAGIAIGAGAAGSAATTTTTTTTPTTPPAKPHNALTITVSPPATYHRAQRFTISVVATLKHRDKHAYLLSFIQFSAKACEADPNKELARTLDTKGAYYHHTFSTSPFTAAVTRTAGKPGPRRVCAYLFDKPITPGEKARPLAHAHAIYSVIK